MKLFAAKKTLFVTSLIVASLVFSFASGSGSTAYASAAADAAASANCAHISGTSTLAESQRAACHRGFVAGYDGTSKATACNGFAGSVKSACNTGFTAGAKAKTNAPAAAGKAGAIAKKTKTQACGIYNVPANKTACEKAFDAQIIVMAKAAGDTAGRAGGANPCDTLGFGGTAAKAACNAAFLKGKNVAGKAARGNCGGVDTYFDFGAICTGADKTAGGNASPIVAIGLAVVGWITALVAVAVIGGIMYGGFLYLTARDNSGQTQKGVVVITNSVVALIVWGFAYALINFVVPGGLFNG